ncbi:lytic transglycosylase domain-containing protein [Novosphingobium sp. ZN18A2]|uniref:lytic transglycosylase domain-containing protein n=1 Tax=Novosphingobium sp. ZN18A2 TaxID=3079861 RepID=UPI0030CCCF11
MSRTRMARAAILGLAAAGTLQAMPAAANSAAAAYFSSRADRTAVPMLLTQDDRTYYTKLFSAIDAKDWSTVQQMFAQRPDGPLHSVARAQYYLAPTSPKIELQPLTDLLQKAPDLPWAAQVESLAQKRGAAALPALPYAQGLVSLPSMPRRQRPPSVDDGTMPSGIADSITDHIVNDDPAGAQQLLDGIDASLSPQARAEWRQKVGWSYYIENNDAMARAVSLSATQGSGPWVAEALWTAGLASWRMDDCQSAALSFERTAAQTANSELRAAGEYWASRAWTRCRRPDKVENLLRSAARADETMYGMLAAEALGMRGQRPDREADFTNADWQKLRTVPNVRDVVALAEIGRDELAGEVLRYQARIGDPSEYGALSRLARDLGLPSTQLWMAYNAPRGARPDEAARFPAPKWVPANGWQVDPALLFAHSLQESSFRTDAVSGAGARGLMQVRPGTARDMASEDPRLSGRSGQLDNPSVNLAFGQLYLEQLRDNSATQGLLPKVMAAYNAGPVPVARWNTEIRDEGDPLLWMESIPYWETRGYVATVMRNYWMYEKQAGGESDSRLGLVEGLWPKFPGLAGADSVRVAYNGR